MIPDVKFIIGENMQEAFQRAREEKFRRDEVPIIIKESENIVWFIDLIVQSIKSPAQESTEIPKIKQALDGYISPIKERLSPILILDSQREGKHIVTISYRTNNNSLIRTTSDPDQKPIKEELADTQTWIKYAAKIPAAVVNDLTSKI